MGGKEDSREVQVSKLLSYYLRHAAEERGISVDANGYVLVESLLAQEEFAREAVDVALLRQVVANNAKQRFQLWTSPDDALYIRAVQGHSMASVRAEELLTPITAEDLEKYPVVVHGTYRQFWENDIKTTGLSRMQRNHVHFAIGYPSDGQVISGMRQTCDVYIELDLAAALSDGMKVYVSVNGVILTEGLDGGIVAPKYFRKVLFK